MFNNNKFNSNPKQAVLLMLISDYLDICDPVLTFDRFMGEIGVEKYRIKSFDKTCCKLNWGFTIIRI